MAGAIAFVLTQSLHGALIVNRLDYGPGGGGVGAQIMEFGVYEEAEACALNKLLLLRRHYYGDGVLALDVGANIGVYTVEWSRLMRGWGEVIGFEAQERIFYAAAGNLALNNCFNARIIWAAVGDKDGEIAIPEPDYSKPSAFGSFELRLRPGGELIGQKIDYNHPTSIVRLMRVDSLNVSRCDLLKIDVEGMELEVLAGAKETINRCKPLIYVERLKVDNGELTAVLGDHGYKVFENPVNYMGVHETDKCLAHITDDSNRFNPKTR